MFYWGIRIEGLQSFMTDLKIFTTSRKIFVSIEKKKGRHKIFFWGGEARFEIDNFDFYANLCLWIGSACPIGFPLIFHFASIFFFLVNVSSEESILQYFCGSRNWEFFKEFSNIRFAHSQIFFLSFFLRSKIFSEEE